ncbi:MAG: DNA mismatch repair protein [Polyangiaceae bacterium]|nr:DNA mismatch repair protein [Myxococcales bacterium]MCB9589110.1 DNA mismatch repair protein [Polyangiaceae bacterium]
MALKSIPDLLFADPLPRLDLDRLRRVVSFVYAAGDSGGALAEALCRVRPIESSFEPGCFARDVFLDDLASSLFAVTLEGREFGVALEYALNVVATPPRAEEDVAYRRGILDELMARPALVERAGESYAAIARLKQHLEDSDPSNPVESVRRRLDLLEDVRGVLLGLAAFSECKSGLGRIAEWAAGQRARPEFARLTELLDFETNLSLMDLRVRVGADGRLRGFDIVKLEENVRNRFYLTPLKRWLNRIHMWFRGYRFGEHELLSRLVDSAFSAFEPQVAALLQLGLDLGMYVGQLQFRARAQRVKLDMRCADLVSGGEGSRLERLFNPLLLAHGVEPIPCDIEFGGNCSVLVVTGPNSGGKTRLMQSLAFAQLLGEGGWLVPAAHARLERAGGLFASLIEEPAADQREGRLGSELLRIRRVFEHARPGALVLLDELCSGTNPSEGEQLFELVVELLFELRPRAFVTTHFLELAQRLERELKPDHPGDLGFLQVELDEHMVPTFGFVPGVASTSLARETASRLGVTRDELLGLIRRHPALPSPSEPPVVDSQANVEAPDSAFDSVRQS